jgi:plastocyanin
VPKKKAKLPLSKTHPKLAKEAFGWDPAVITFGVGKKLKWKCKNEHTWEASPNTRSGEKGPGCPYCSGRLPVVGVNDLKTTHPELAKQAVGWNPKNFSAGSGKKVKWKCKKGHVRLAVISSRALRGSDCGVCMGREVLTGFNDLATEYPSIAKEIVNLNPKKIFARSEKIADWRCKKGHSWRASISNRTRLKSGCPFCAGQKVIVGETDILTTHPEIASQAYGWNPKDYSIGSGIDLKWKCKNGHIWYAKPHKRKRGDGCTVCSGNTLSGGENDLQTTHPQLASQAFEWDPRTVSAGHNLKKK